MSTVIQRQKSAKEKAAQVLGSLAPEPPPLRMDAGGTLRVGPTRVRLDTVIYAFNTGSTAEEILEDYPTLNLPDIYLIIAYYLRHREIVDAYLADGEKLAEAVQQENEARWSKGGIKERLLARRSAREQAQCSDS